jgi:hypothetical protein
MAKCRCLWVTDGRVKLQQQHVEVGTLQLLVGEESGGNSEATPTHCSLGLCCCLLIIRWCQPFKPPEDCTQLRAFELPCDRANIETVCCVLLPRLIQVVPTL